PGDAARRKKLGTRWRWHAPDVQVCVTVMRGHLPPTTAGVAFCKIFQAELASGHAAPKNQATVAIIRNDMVVGRHLDRNRRQRFMAHPRDVKMSFALTNQILFAQIGVPALKNDP